MNEYLIGLIFLMTLDIFFTYYNAILYKKLYPKRDYTKIEKNPIVLRAWKKLGIKWGFLFHIIMVLIILGLIHNKEGILILIGMYFLVLVYHIENLLELKQELNKRNLYKNKKPNRTRVIIFAIFVFLFLLDMMSTFYYVSNYSEWQPEKPYNLMEKNPMLVFLWNLLGLPIGTIVGGAIILSLLYLIAFKSSGGCGWVTIGGIVCLFIFAIINNIINTNLLIKLREIYP